MSTVDLSKILLERLKYFYFEEFEDIIKKFKRGPLLCIFLKILYATQLISLMFTNNTNALRRTQADSYLMVPFFSVLNATKFFPLFDMAFMFKDS